METPRICFTLQQALNTRLPNCYNTFIVQNEDRKFLVFKSVEDYYERIKYYNNCHEVVIFKDEKAKGRLVFDFDYKYEHMKPNVEFPTNFCSEIQKTIKLVFSKYYDVMPNMKFIWLRCENKNKISFHLIVKGAYFAEDWKNQMIDFYTLMLDEMQKNDTFNFYEECYLDKGIARHNATLRMPFNCKKNGNPLLPYFEGEEEPFEFYDGLISVIRPMDLAKETKIYKMNLKIEKEDKDFQHEDYDFNPEDVYRQFQFMNDGVFKMGPVDKSFITLLRKKASNCLVDKTRFHESDNSYLIVNKFGIWFGCHRGCTCMGKKLIQVKKFEQEFIKVEEIQNCPAFELAEKNWRIKNWFVQDRIKDKFVSLKRIKPGKCLMGNEPHDNENAYLVVNNNFVSFGCSKGCLSADNKKTKFIGKLQ